MASNAKDKESKEVKKETKEGPSSIVKNNPATTRIKYTVPSKKGAGNGRLKVSVAEAKEKN